MSLRRAWRFLIAAVLAVAPVPLATASPAAADDTASVDIEAPTEVRAGDQYTVVVTANLGDAVPSGTYASLDILLGPRVVVSGIDDGGSFCETNPSRIDFEVVCTVDGPRTGTVTISVDVVVGPGEEMGGSRDAVILYLPDGQRLIGLSDDIHILGSESTMHVAIDTPSRARQGEVFTITATGTTDLSISDYPVIFSIDSLDFVVTAVSAPGFTCAINSGDASCQATDLSDSVTLTATVRAPRGIVGPERITATLDINHAKVSVFGSVELIFV